MTSDGCRMNIQWSNGSLGVLAAVKWSKLRVILHYVKQKNRVCNQIKPHLEPGLPLDSATSSADKLLLSLVSFKFPMIRSQNIPKLHSYLPHPPRRA
ncbi:rCG51885 [Rattus norvegicus]|uniref:RCG51885 n=1 Tax=Rattus norvegicus TaxID=10116 RepID=A6K2T5_RAT|nr:rCG51885 [Rattus norvegicus]